MNKNTPEDLAIIGEVAKFMGYRSMPYYEDEVSEAGEYFFVVGNSPERGKTYPNGEILQGMGSLAYGLQWYYWNPLTNASDQMMVIGRFHELGQRVILNISPDSVWCSLSALDSSYQERYVIGVELPTLGQALCAVAMEWIAFNSAQPQPA